MKATARSKPKRAFVIGSCVLAALVAATSLASAPAVQAVVPAEPVPAAGQAPEATSAPATYVLFLAALARAGSPPAPPTATPSATPPISGAVAGFFLPWEFESGPQATDGPSLAVDASGGVHVAYAAFTSDASGNRPAYYVYCPANCTSPASFSAPVVFNGRIDHVNLALDGSGHPRIMWEGIDPARERLSAYVYLACDTVCTNPANWQTTRVVALDDTLAHSSRFFAVDPQGHPGLVYYRSWSGADNGTYFAGCSTGCTNAANWQHTRISPAELRFPVLAFTSGGLPRIAGTYLDVSSEPALNYLVYLECGAGCPTVTQGAAYPIFVCYLCDEPKGYFDLALDSSNRPRLALYTGPLETGRGLDPNQLYYIFCNLNCGDLNAAAWDGYALGVPPGSGTYVRMAVDAGNRPRLAYEDVSYGLQYTWCESGCEGTYPAWQSLLADSSAILDQTEPVPPIPPCQVAGWFTGKRPSLALDPAGNPRFAYDAEHWQGLQPVNHPPGSPGCGGFSRDQINARFTTFSQP